MGTSTGKRPRSLERLVRRVLLPPLFAGAVALCVLLAAALSSGKEEKASAALLSTTQDEIVRQIAVDVEGTPTPVDVRRARRPLSERKRLLYAHPYYALYRAAKRRFDVSWVLVAAVHYQETGFARAPATLASSGPWLRHRKAMRGMTRPARYPNRTKRHPSPGDDFDVVMAIAADLRSRGARAEATDAAARRAVTSRYGPGPAGRLKTAMVLERAAAWRLLGTLPLPGRGELATPVQGVVGGCGYFRCPRPGHLHNGVDVLAPTGTPIHAADAGVVASVELPGQSGGYGTFVCIQHRPHLATCYAHMSAVAVAIHAGSQVRRGEVIGLVGSTGSSSAPHLHFEVRAGAADCSRCAVDPLPLLSGEVPDAAVPAMLEPPPEVPSDEDEDAHGRSHRKLKHDERDLGPADAHERSAVTRGRDRARSGGMAGGGGPAPRPSPRDIPTVTTPPVTTTTTAPPATTTPAPATTTAPSTPPPAAPPPAPGTGQAPPAPPPPPPPPPGLFG